MANPAFSDKVWNRISEVAKSDTMTINGAIHKSGLLVVIALFGGAMGALYPNLALAMIALIANLGLCIAIIFKPQRAEYLSQPYAFVEGYVLGGISIFYAVKYPGIVTNALFLTVGCLALMLALYYFRVIQVNERLRSGIILATGAIALTYFVDLILGFFGMHVPLIHESSKGGIIFSVFVVGLAAFNLLLDFDMIEKADAEKAPKFMEWYCGFALLLTLVWLYMEILRVLGKARKN